MNMSKRRGIFDSDEESSLSNINSRLVQTKKTKKITFQKSQL